MVECVVIVIGMRYKVNFLNQRTNRWCHVVITDGELILGKIDVAIMAKFNNIPFTIYKIEAITE